MEGSSLGTTWIPRRPSVIALAQTVEKKFSKELNLDEVFSLGYIQLNSFAKRLTELKKKRSLEKKPFKKIDFSRVGHITDSAIKVLVNVLGKESFNEVTLISLEGCSVLTDLGLYWLVQALDGDKADIWININGCTKVTDSGLAALFNCPRINRIDAIATSVSHFNFGVNITGCPLLTVASSISSSKEQKESYLLIIPIGTKESLAEYLCSSKGQERKALHYHQRVQVQDWNLNIVEAERSHVLFQHLLPPNPVHVLIPFDANLDLNAVKGQIEDTIAHVLSKEQPNPQHKEQVNAIVPGSNAWLDCSLWNRTDLSMNGVLRNLAANPSSAPGAVSCRQPLSRSNNYFEVRVIEGIKDTNQSALLLIGIMLDVLYLLRFPTESKERQGGVIHGLPLKEGVTYGFGVEGEWLSEYVPGPDSAFYFTENGERMLDKDVEQKPRIGMYPFIMLAGNNLCAVQIVNKLVPPEILQEKWIKDQMIHTPSYKYNVLCDDQGIVSYAECKDAFGKTGWIHMQEDVTATNNVFAIRIIDKGFGNGGLSIGFGPENYPLGAHPGWRKHSLALHGDNGKLYPEKSSGSVPKEGGKVVVWQNGDVIKMVVNGLKKDEVISDGTSFTVDFYVNDVKVAQEPFTMRDYFPSNRIVFMVGMNVLKSFVQILNFKPVYLNPPNKMNMLTMGRCHFMDIMDDGTLKYKSFHKRHMFSLFMSKTPFNQQLQYFEMKVKTLGKEKHCGIGLCHGNYPTNNMLGWLPGSIGYHADNGEVYDGNQQSIKPLEDIDGSFQDGDVVGCGIDGTKAEFRPDGTLVNQQTLFVYFTKNGKKIHVVSYNYKTEALYPAINLHYDGTELKLENYYPGSEAGNLILDGVIKKDETDKAPKKNLIEGCQFTVVAMGSQKSNPKGKASSLQKLMTNGPQFSMLPLIDKKLAEMDGKGEALDMQKQQKQAALLWQKECLQRFSKSKSRLNFTSMDTSSNEDVNELHKVIIKTCENDFDLHFKFYNLPETATNAMDMATTYLEKGKLFAAYELRNIIDKKYCSNGRVYEVLVRFLQKQGRIIWLPMKRTVVAIDMAFAETLVRMSGTLSTTPSCHMAPCIGQETKIWMNIADMVPDFKQLMDSKSELMSHVLMFFGLIEIPCIRTTKEDPLFCYCTPNGLGQLPVNLDNFIGEGANDVIIIRRDYRFLYNHPENILSMIISRCLMFSRPVAIASTWCVFQTGAAQITIFVKEQDLIIETRCFMPSHQTHALNKDTKSNVEEYSWHIFCIFIDLIELIITRLRLKITYSQNVPPGLVNTSIGCLHTWGLSEEPYRQTKCTLCNMCCEKGRICEYNRVPGTYEHQCGCGTIITGCRDCGICQNCADTLWTIRSYLRPNMEVASYGDMKSCQLFPLNSTTYDEIEITNLGRNPAPICLRSFFDLASSLTLMFPGMAMEVPSASSVEKVINTSLHSGEMEFKQGDIVTIHLDPIKRDHKVLMKPEEILVRPSEPVYFTCICRDVTVWHDTGILGYTSVSNAEPVAQFIAANPLTPEVNSFSFEILNRGRNCYIGIGLCPKRYPAGRQPGWNKGSVAYHADDGGLFEGMGAATDRKQTCTTGDIMKCEIDFENKKVNFYKNGGLVHRSDIQMASGYHAAVGLHSKGESVRLLEKEPWSVKEVEERTLPNAFDSYKYGNMYISPGRRLALYRSKQELTAWLMLHNPSKNVVGYKIFLPPEPENCAATFLKPGQSYSQLLDLPFNTLEKFTNLDIHWFMLESSRDYSTVNIDEIYEATTHESLLTHRLNLEIKGHGQADFENLKVATVEPDASDGYLAEVFKNGISVQKYWLRDGSYVCSIPLESNVLVRYPKFPTLNHPESLQKGMRLIMDLTSIEKDTFAEGWVQEVTPNGTVKLEYSLPGKDFNSTMEVPVTSNVINLKEIHYEKVLKAMPVKKNKEDQSEPTGETTMEAVLNILSYEPRGNTSAIKSAYKFAPFHLLTKASQDALKSLDSSWESTTLQSVALCKTTPTRVTVQELQISQIAGDDLNWLLGANPSRKYDVAFAFLPSQLGLNSMCYPSLPAMFNNIDVHRLCLQTDQMNLNMALSKEHGIIPDMPLHFVNIIPVTPSPELKADTKYASHFNAWVYSTLYLNKMLLPKCDNMFHGGSPPDLERKQLEQMMKTLIHIYASQCHLFAEQHGGIAFQESPENGTELISSSIKHKNDVLVRAPETVETADDILLRPFKLKNNAYCKAHLYCTEGAAMLEDDIFTMRFEQVTPYQDTINFVYRKMPGLPSLPPKFFNYFKNLQYLKLTHCDKLHIIPNGISKCTRLELFCLESSAVVQLPEDFFQVSSLSTVHCDGLLIQELPRQVAATCQIRELKLCSMQLQSVPSELGLLVSLEVLNLDSNPLKSLPMELSTLVNLKSLHLCGIKWLFHGSSKTELPQYQYEEFLETNCSLANYLGKGKAMILFKEYDKNNNSMLDNDEISALNSYFFWNIPRLGAKDINDTEYGGFPPVIFLLTSLENLYLDYQAITFVPEHIGRLQNLKMLSLSQNPLLERLSGALGHAPSLTSIRVFGNPSLQTPPHEVYSRGFMAIKAYLKRLAEGLSECRRTKLMFVGLGGAGKTSLLKSLMSVNKRIDENTEEEVTDGIMIAPWTVKTSDNVEITYSCWDFAGQTLYYNTHQFFLSKRAVYLLLWSSRQGFEHSGIEFWLNSIASHTTEAPIFIVATHCDEVPPAPIPKEDLLKRYPQIAAFFFVSSKTGDKIRELEQEMLRVTLAQKNMGEQVPQVWLNLEKKILGARHQDDILEWDTIKQFAIEVGLYDDKDIREAISFLNELGTVQYFDTDFLRDKIVINPQWIVNVMACVVSVKDSPIQHQLGRFLHKDIPKIWSTYDPKLHTWLLQLTEEFDLTFPLPKEEVNIVPCILPQEQPKEFYWPTPDHENNMKETKIVYKFEFLPAGLFNRAQVRLFQLSDGKLMWKKGSLLKKNKHLALVEQMTETELVVKVQGPRPENVIFLIHEIFESLVDESFHGVRYDFMVPCPDCIEKECTLEPSLFEGYLIRKASEFRAPFLQCRKYFHTISMTQLLEIMPSNSTTDFDAHLQTSLQILQELNNAIAKDVAILCCSKDAKSSDCVNPQQVRADLEAVGYSCWVSEDDAEHDLMMAIKNCRILVVLCSDNFEHDKKFRDLLLYSLDSLKKSYVIVAVGKSTDWMNTNMGMRIGKQELMVMISDKSKYESKITELRNLVEIKLAGLSKTTRKFCSVFVSYCWENSTIAKNGETKHGCIGWGDPRTIKQSLEERGISCWLDVESIASCSGENKGLFQTIAEGMNNCKVILVCISDEYIKSENCMRELRFGVLNLKKPVVFAVVGTGKKWKKSEAVLLRGDSISSEMTVSFQKPNEEGIDELASFIRELLPNNAEQVIQKEAIQKDMEAMQAKEKEKTQSGQRKPDKDTMQEECELVQRKFMRYIISYVSSQDTVLAPRLFIFDFEKSAKSDGLDMMDASVRSSVARPTLRPKSSSRSSRQMMMPVNVEDDAELWETESFCIKLLCENEHGWHVCKKQFPVKHMDVMKGLIQGCSAYLARMYAILRQSNVMLNCFKGPKGEKFLSWVEESAVIDVNFVQSYTTIRRVLSEDDGAQSFMVQLNRYHLPTGKIYWLCDEHSKGPRILHLSSETVTNKEVMKMLEDEDIKMRECMEEIVKTKKEAKPSNKKKIILPSFEKLPPGSLNKSDNLERTNSKLNKLKEEPKPKQNAGKGEEQNRVKSPPPSKPLSRQNSAVKVNDPPPPAAAKPPKPTSSSTKSRQSLSSAKSTSGSNSGSKTCILQ